jgi:hypothetical protein
MDKACSTHGAKRIVYRVLVGKPQETDLDIGERIILK